MCRIRNSSFPSPSSHIFPPSAEPITSDIWYLIWWYQRYPVVNKKSLNFNIAFDNHTCTTAYIHRRVWKITQGQLEKLWGHLRKFVLVKHHGFVRSVKIQMHKYSEMKYKNTDAQTNANTKKSICENLYGQTPRFRVGRPDWERRSVIDWKFLNLPWI